MLDCPGFSHSGYEHFFHLMQRELYPKLIQDVQLMINELENVTVLWEELWLSTLQDLHAGKCSFTIIRLLLLGAPILNIAFHDSMMHQS